MRKWKIFKSKELSHKLTCTLITFTAQKKKTDLTRWRICEAGISVSLAVKSRDANGCIATWGSVQHIILRGLEQTKGNATKRWGLDRGTNVACVVPQLRPPFWGSSLCGESKKCKGIDDTLAGTQERLETSGKKKKRQLFTCSALPSQWLPLSSNTKTTETEINRKRVTAFLSDEGIGGFGFCGSEWKKKKTPRQKFNGLCRWWGGIVSENRLNPKGLGKSIRGMGKRSYQCHVARRSPRFAAVSVTHQIRKLYRGGESARGQEVLESSGET